MNDSELKQKIKEAKQLLNEAFTTVQKSGIEPYYDSLVAPNQIATEKNFCFREVPHKSQSI